MPEVIVKPDRCPTGCGRSVKFGHLMCGPCWGMVPRHLQRRVLTTWSMYRKLVGDSGRSPEDRKAARTLYEEAKNEALASVP